MLPRLWPFVGVAPASGNGVPKPHGIVRKRIGTSMCFHCGNVGVLIYLYVAAFGFLAFFFVILQHAFYKTRIAVTKSTKQQRNNK